MRVRVRALQSKIKERRKGNRIYYESRVVFEKNVPVGEKWIAVEHNNLIILLPSNLLDRLPQMLDEIREELLRMRAPA